MFFLLLSSAKRASASESRERKERRKEENGELPMLQVDPPYPGSHSHLSGPTLDDGPRRRGGKEKTSMWYRGIKKSLVPTPLFGGGPPQSQPSWAMLMIITRFRASTAGHRWARNCCCPPSSRSPGSTPPPLSSSPPTVCKRYQQKESF